MLPAIPFCMLSASEIVGNPLTIISLIKLSNGLRTLFGRHGCEVNCFNRTQGIAHHLQIAFLHIALPPQRGIGRHPLTTCEIRCRLTGQALLNLTFCYIIAQNLIYHFAIDGVNSRVVDGIELEIGECQRDVWLTFYHALARHGDASA